MPRLDGAAREALAAFTEDVYLHQSVERDGDTLRRYRDLPEALAVISRDAAPELRIHFHVPIFIERYGVLESTQAFLRELLALHRVRPISPHLEVETYTWDVLPPGLRALDVRSSGLRACWASCSHWCCNASYRGT